jgi:hypothetical protein
MEVGLFQKKPVNVRAVRWDGTPEEAARIVAWIAGQGGDAQHISVPELTDSISIATLEGDMHATPGDWVIQGIKDEFYPCKDDIFVESYRSVSVG